jgi:hypothetical protein
MAIAWSSMPQVPDSDYGGNWFDGIPGDQIGHSKASRTLARPVT